MSWQATSHSGFMETDMMSKEYYWRIFGKTHIEKNDRKLLDTDEELPKQLEHSLKQIYIHNLNQDTAATELSVPIAASVYGLSKENQYSPEIKIPNRLDKGWYRVYASVYYPDKEWELWKSPQYIVSLYANGVKLKDKMVRVGRITEPSYWQQVYVDIQLPEQAPNEIRIMLWNAESDKQIFIKDIEVKYASN
jgi:hypothetical protein